MDYESRSPFDSIESAHAFLELLSEAIAESKRDIDVDIQRELSGQSPRRLEALQVASYNLGKLELQMMKSCRILNDLRSLRRLLFEERKTVGALTVQSKPIPIAEPELQVAPLPSKSQSK